MKRVLKKMIKLYNNFLNMYSEVIIMIQGTKFIINKYYFFYKKYPPFIKKYLPLFIEDFLRAYFFMESQLLLQIFAEIIDNFFIKKIVFLISKPFYIGTVILVIYRTVYYLIHFLIKNYLIIQYYDIRFLVLSNLFLFIIFFLALYDLTCINYFQKKFENFHCTLFNNINQNKNYSLEIKNTFITELSNENFKNYLKCLFLILLIINIVLYLFLLSVIIFNLYILIGVLLF